MRRTVELILLFVLFFSISCNIKPIEPFELTVTDYNYSLDHSILYQLSNEKLNITLENKKDRILFSTTELPKSKIQQLANINIDSLSTYYVNLCVKDRGDIKSFKFKKNGKYKSVLLGTYYHTKLSPAIEIINEIVPEKYKMNFDKNLLIKWMEDSPKCLIIKP